MKMPKGMHALTLTGRGPALIPCFLVFPGGPQASLPASINFLQCLISLDKEEGGGEAPSGTSGNSGGSEAEAGASSLDVNVSCPIPVQQDDLAGEKLPA